MTDPTAFFDPGLRGAVAILGGGANEVHDLPTMGAGKQVILNGRELTLILERAGARRAVIEHVHSMPKQGVSSMFKFGTAFGQILGVVQAIGLPYELVQPAVWKRAMKLPAGAGKSEAVRGRAIELFPDLAPELRRARDHNRAEALLLGRWWQQHGGV